MKRVYEGPELIKATDKPISDNKEDNNMFDKKPKAYPDNFINDASFYEVYAGPAMMGGINSDGVEKGESKGKSDELKKDDPTIFMAVYAGPAQMSANGPMLNNLRNNAFCNNKSNGDVPNAEPVEYKFCTECGFKMKSTYNFCPGCGAKAGER